MQTYAIFRGLTNLLCIYLMFTSLFWGYWSFILCLFRILLHFLGVHLDFFEFMLIFNS
jgi:hypothetical protein